MDDCPEIVLKKLCCTCLSKDRKLFQLCRLPDGVNNLYLLLSFDSEAYREGFYKDMASLFICWECKAIICRFTKFRQQACTAQRLLTSIADGQVDMQTQDSCLSCLSSSHSTSYITHISSTDTLSDNFIDCGPPTDIKSESEEDIPLSELHNNWISDNEADITRESIDSKEVYTEEVDYKEDDNILYKLAKKVIKYKKKKKLKIGKKSKILFSTVLISDSELEDIRSKKKMAAVYVDAAFKCDSCIEGFQNKADLDEHNTSLHMEKPHHIQCDKCLVYINISTYQEHRESHYNKYLCKLCAHTSYNLNDIVTHLRSGHSTKNQVLPGERNKVRKTSELLNSGSKPRRNRSVMDKRTPFGYQCIECNKYFDNKNQRWKHVQRHHREGYKCVTCGKRFAFKNNLTRHEQLHQAPPPRQECEVCHKMIRVDLLKIHSRIHSDRQRFSCVECAKCFVSRASYEHHLKYTQAHAQTDILKYKCTVCDKGYRSRGELQDHVNYQHMGKTQHKCPVCGKALATRRCITRHVRRAHDGVKESARDKICQQCGKAFRDKKGLREHELIHTGERPLSCEICGCTFRQSASLYTHRKRVHKIYPNTKRVTLLEQTSS